MMLQHEDRFEADTTTDNWYYLEKNDFCNTIDTPRPYTDNILYTSIPTQQLPVKPAKRSEKRPRTIFTTHQILTLEKSFQQSNYIDKISRTALANKLYLSERTIKLWFQNRRMKKRKEERSLKSKITQVTNCSSIENQRLHSVEQIPHQESPKQMHSLSNDQISEDINQYSPSALNTQLRPNQLNQDQKNSMNANSPLTYLCSTSENEIFKECNSNLHSEVVKITDFSPNLDDCKQQYPQVNNLYSHNSDDFIYRDFEQVFRKTDFSPYLDDCKQQYPQVNNSYSHNSDNLIYRDFEQFSDKSQTYSATYTEILQNGEYYNFYVDSNLW